MLAAELDHRRSAGHAVLRFQRTRFVINAGMNDAAVVSGLMPRDCVFFFEDGNSAIAERPDRFEGRGQANNSPTDNDQIKLQVHRVDNTMTE